MNIFFDLRKTPIYYSRAFAIKFSYKFSMATEPQLQFKGPAVSSQAGAIPS